MENFLKESEDKHTRVGPRVLRLWWGPGDNLGLGSWADPCNSVHSFHNGVDFVGNPETYLYANDPGMPHWSLGTHAEGNVLTRPQGDVRRPVRKWVWILGFNLCGFNPRLYK